MAWRGSRAWSVSRAGVYRFLKRTTLPAIPRRRGPTGPCRDADLADHIRREIEGSDFHGEGYRKLWARLRVAGVRSSPRRVRRVMGENGLLAHHRVAFARRYDETWLVARHGYKTPARVREEQTMPQIAIDPTLAATLPLAA
jgi:hypothetical protein